MIESFILWIIRKISYYILSFLIVNSILTLSFFKGFKNEKAFLKNKNFLAKTIPIFSQEEITEAPRKRAGIEAKKGINLGPLNIIGYQSCNNQNEKDCVDKLKELNLEYYHCYESSSGQIIRCEYKKNNQSCSNPKFK